MRSRVPPENYSECRDPQKNTATASLTLFSEACSVDEDGAASVAKDLPADPAVMSSPKRRELDRAGVAAGRDMV